jgi:hypothetical protein
VLCTLLSSAQSFWLQIQRSWIRFSALPDLEVVGLERGPLSLLSTIEKLIGRNSSDSGLEIREYGLGIRCADHAILSVRKSLH